MKIEFNKDYAPLVVKVGSESACFKGGNLERLAQLAHDISFLMTAIKLRVVLVTSGAVSHGREALGIPKERSLSSEEKRALASIGQPYLMANWSKVFQGCHEKIRLPAVGQGLVTHAMIEENLSHKNGLLSGLEWLWSYGALPILNENDFATPEEIIALEKWADNDKNALLVARLVQAKHLAVMTNTNGVYQEADHPESRIQTIRSAYLTDDFIDTVCGKKSDTGTGGMHSKLEVAREAGKNGITTHIFHGNPNASTLFQHMIEEFRPSGSKRTGWTVIKSGISL